MKVVLIIALLAACIACNPGFVHVDCDAHPRTSQGLGKVSCEFGNLF